MKDQHEVIPRYLKFSAAEHRWITDALLRDNAAPAWKPTAGTKISEQAVNEMTSDAQWGYRANQSTRPKRVPKLRAALPGELKRKRRPASRGVSEHVCAACGLAVHPVGQRGKWKHATGGRASCGKPAEVVARSEYERLAVAA